MKVEIIERYTDSRLRKEMAVGDIIEVDESRGAVLVEQGVAKEADRLTKALEKPKKEV